MESEASSNVEDFYELELNINGLNNIYQSLEDYFGVEELRGENGYFCHSCRTRVDASCFVKLRQLPSVLNFHLKRYLFLPETMTMKKITSIFSFPDELNMGGQLVSGTWKDIMYELSAILIHKGTTADSGHYIAHIKDDNTGQWWEFDDEHVSKLGKNPFGRERGSSSAKSSPHAQMEHHRNISNGSHTAGSSRGEAAMFSSTEAYMLMYRLERGEYGNSQGGGNSVVGDSLPPHLSQHMQQLNASYAKDCQEFRRKKDYINARRHEVKSILSEAPVSSDDAAGPYFWISTEWLHQWAHMLTPPTIDNSTIQCVHKKVPASKILSLKRLSSSSWKKLVSKYGGGPALSNEDCCIECIKLDATHAICAANYRYRKASLKQIAKDALTGSCSKDENLYYVSRSWLMSWLRTDALCDADAGPTASLRCPHGYLLPEHASGAKRVLVPEGLWLFIQENATAVRPADSFGCQIFPSCSEPCSICNAQLTEQTRLESSLRGSKRKQRQNHEKLMPRLNYQDEDICVVLVSGKEPPKSLLDASLTIPKFDGRISKRRKTSTGNTITLKVSCTTSIYQLKMMVWERFGVVKENQKLHKGSVEIEDDFSTLADKFIFPGDVLWVSDSGIHGNRDIADELSNEKTEMNRAEKGFRGTLLSSDISAVEQRDRRRS